MKTLSQILTDANSTLDLEAEEPTGDELTLRQNYANQSVWDVSGIVQLSEFKNEYLTCISTNVTVPLPSNFRELQEDPRLLDNTVWTSYPELELEERYTKNPGDKYSYILGNPAAGYFLILNDPEPNCTLSIIYQRYPSGMATLTDICELSDPTFVTRKIESYVLFARSDDKFQIAEARAQTSLQNMAGREMKGSGGQSKDTPMKFASPLE